MVTFFPWYFPNGKRIFITLSLATENNLLETACIKTKQKEWEMNSSNHTRCLFNTLAARLVLSGLFLLVIGSLPTSHAHADDLFVTTTGSGNACSQETPCTLQTALDTALSSDTVFMAAGSYTGTDHAVLITNKTINIYGGWDGTTTTPPVRDPNAHLTTIDGENARRGIYISGYIAPVVDGLRIINGNAAGLWGYEYPAGTYYDAGGGVFVAGGDVTLTNNIISNNSAEYGGGVFLNDSPGTLAHSTISENTVTDGGGGVFVYKNTPTLSNNIITFNTSSNLGGGLYLFSTTASLQNNMITDNDAVHHSGGVSVASCSPVFTGNIIARNKANNGAGITLGYSQSTFVNNVIVDNQLISATGRGSALDLYASFPDLKHTTFARNSGGDGSAVFISKGSSPTNSSVSMANTILAGHTVGVHVDAGSTLTHDGTLWGTGSWANTTDQDGSGTINTGTVNIWGNPDFIDPDNGNYHINVDSTAIDGGMDAGVTEDLDGDVRPLGKGYDIGADEYVPTVSVFPWNMFLPAMTKTGQL